MQELVKRKCKPCEGGVPAYTEAQARAELKGLKGWALENGRLVKLYPFGNYHQTTTGRLSINFGDMLTVTGTALLDGGELHVRGKKTYVTVPSRQTVLRADGGLTGQFASLTAAPGIFLTGTVGYTTNEAWLDVTRLDVPAAER